MNAAGIEYALAKLADYGALVNPEDPNTEQMRMMLDGIGLPAQAGDELFIGLSRQFTAEHLPALWPCVLFGVILTRLATEHAVLAGK